MSADPGPSPDYEHRVRNHLNTGCKRTAAPDCPLCGGSLWDVGQPLAGSPPLVPVCCRQCGYALLFSEPAMVRARAFGRSPGLPGTFG